MQAAHALPAADPFAVAAQHLAAARNIGREVAHTLAERAEELGKLAAQAAALDSVPVGAREEARRLADTLNAASARLAAIVARTGA